MPDVGVVEEVGQRPLRAIHLIWAGLGMLAAVGALVIAAHGDGGGMVLAAALWWMTGFLALSLIGLSVAVPRWIGALSLAQTLAAGGAGMCWPTSGPSSGGHAALPRLLGHPALSSGAESSWATAAGALLAATLALGLGMYVAVWVLSRRPGWRQRRDGLPWLWYLAWSDADPRVRPGCARRDDA